MKLNFLRSVSCHLQPVMESAGIYKHNKHHVQTLFQHKHHKNIIQKKILSTAYINTHHIISYNIYHINTISYLVGWLSSFPFRYKMRHWCACFQMYQLVHRKGDLAVSEFVFFRNKHLKRVGDRI